MVGVDEAPRPIWVSLGWNRNDTFRNIKLPLNRPCLRAFPVHLKSVILNMLYIVCMCNRIGAHVACSFAILPIVQQFRCGWSGKVERVTRCASFSFPYYYWIGGRVTGRDARRDYNWTWNLNLVPCSIALHWIFVTLRSVVIWLLTGGRGSRWIGWMEYTSVELACTEFRIPSLLSRL